MKIVLATQNPGKVAELRKLLPPSFEILTPEDVGITGGIPETGLTLRQNARQKSEYVFEISGIPSLADDTGLEVEHLNGAPGVFSARYAGDAKDNEQNMNKLLAELEGVDNRKAQFKTVLAFTTDKGVELFEGIAKGEIAHERLSGPYGFGYDPVFVPEGFDCSFAQMTPEEKNSLSHRGRALREFISWIINS
jgi:XTP/dITP diphosphohydrolase